MEPFEQLVGSGRDVAERDPGVLCGGEARPVYQVFVASSKFASIKNRLYSRRREIVRNIKRGRVCMGMKLRGIMVRFKEGDVEDRM